MRDVPQLEALKSSLTEQQTEPIKSNCIRNCCLDGQDICMGCFRSLEEIKIWSSADNSERLTILAMAKERKLKNVKYP